ncbi:hypothetical protein ACHWQZ_G018081 [Mnemiopsis leidyi]
MYAGSEVIERVTELREQKIDDQETIIKLQQTVIEKSSENFQSVKNTVQEELKSYSSVLTKSCSNAFSPKKLEAVVKKVTVTEKMSKNAIVYGLIETEHETLLKKVEEVLAEIGEKPNLTSCSRVGTKRDNAIRPVKITLKSIDHVNQILRNAKMLHTKAGYSGIYICPDRTAEQRKADKRLWEQLKTKRKMEPEKDHRIQNGRIVSSEKDSKPAVSNVETSFTMTTSTAWTRRGTRKPTGDVSTKPSLLRTAGTPRQRTDPLYEAAYSSSFPF